MQINNPTILYFLGLLIIPILVHLFQLQKFVEIPFTNVAFLQKINQQNRKSSQVKKWLLLLVRMILFLAILFAFSQPYISEENESQKLEKFIYLDTSLSLNAKGEKGDLLKIALQEIVENSSEGETYILQTNTDFYPKLSKYELKKILLKVKTTSKKLSISSILLKIKNLQQKKTNTLIESILISDFQNTYINEFTNVTHPISLIKLEATTKSNISIDSIFITETLIDKINLKAIIRNQGEKKNNIPITLYNGKKLINKQVFSIGENTNKSITFTIEKETNFSGNIRLTFPDTFLFDNHFKFHISSRNKTNILSIGKQAKFLSKIYTNNEFNFTKFTPKNINYNAIQNQQLIILNEINTISTPLQNSLVDFLKDGGNLVIIPSSNLVVQSYNSFFNKWSIGNIDKKKKYLLKITDINFKHPFFKNVFYKQIHNFQYPNSKSYYPTYFENSTNLISYENQEGFLKEITTKSGTVFLFSNALNTENSNFTNAPLVVPVFYNFGQQSLHLGELYYELGKENNIDIATQVQKDEILSIIGNNKRYIPLQQSFQNKVILSIVDEPESAGFYGVVKGKNTLRTLAFNNPKSESNLSFLNTKLLAKNNQNISVSNSVKQRFKEIDQKNEVRWLWKWFLGLAIVSLLLEILILKFFKS